MHTILSIFVELTAKILDIKEKQLQKYIFPFLILTIIATNILAIILYAWSFFKTNYSDHNIIKIEGEGLSMPQQQAVIFLTLWVILSFNVFLDIMFYTLGYNKSLDPKYVLSIMGIYVIIFFVQYLIDFIKVFIEGDDI